MDKNWASTQRNRRRMPLSNDSTTTIQDRLRRKKEIDEQRRERHRIQVEEFRLKRLEEQQSKSSKERKYFTKAMEKDRRSWILGMGNASPTNGTSQNSPISTSSRQQYNKAMQKLEKCGRLSAESESSENSSKSEPSTHNGLSYTRHSAIYHSSQFQVSDLVNQEKSIKNCGADVSKCELCLKNYDTEILGKTNVEPDQTKKMQEDLRRLVRSGVYLMLLVDFCRDSFQDLLRDRETVTDLAASREIVIHPPHASITRREAVYTARDEEGPNSSDENEEYVSREQVKQRSHYLNRNR